MEKKNTKFMLTQETSETVSIKGIVWIKGMESYIPKRDPSILWNKDIEKRYICITSEEML